jgi:hypothetical protein
MVSYGETDNSEILKLIKKDIHKRVIKIFNNTLNIRTYKIEHGMQIIVQNEQFNEIRNNKDVTDKFALLQIKINDVWWSIGFIDKNKPDEKVYFKFNFEDKIYIQEGIDDGE